MSIIELILLSIGLALDAFAVSLGIAANGMLKDKRSTFRLAFHFGLFQTLMPIVGWLVGGGFKTVITSYDHWIAFSLLGIVGVKMIKESFSKEVEEKKSNPSKGWNLILLSLATSIDALAVGFSLAFLNISIWYPSLMIGIVTGSLSLVGIIIGKKFGDRLGKKMEFVGGTIVTGIGIKILFTHLIP